MTRMRRGAGRASDSDAGIGRRAVAALGLSAPWLRAAAQERVWRIGYLTTGRPGIGFFELLAQRLRQGAVLPAPRWAFEARYADNRLERLPALAEELLRWGPDIVLATNTPAVFAARDGIPGVPVVMAAAADPVGSGLVRSLARPGGRVTGLSAIGPDLAAKTIELLRELRPGLQQVAALLQAGDPFTPTLQKSLADAARALRVGLLPVRVSDDAGIQAAFAEWARQRVDSVFVQPTVAFSPAIERALRHRMASCSFVRGFPLQGGLFAYATNPAEVVERAAEYVERLVRGARAEDLPVQQVAVYDLVFNATTARALQLAPPPGFLSRITEMLT